MNEQTETTDTTIVETPKRKIVFPAVNVKKIVVTTLAVVGTVTLAKAAKNHFSHNESTDDSNVEVETSDV